MTDEELLDAYRHWTDEELLTHFNACRDEALVQKKRWKDARLAAVCRARGDIYHRCLTLRGAW
jgi:hypothetical protein